MSKWYDLAALSAWNGTHDSETIFNYRIGMPSVGLRCCSARLLEGKVYANSRRFGFLGLQESHHAMSPFTELLSKEKNQRHL